jgi:tetratricopeptide (TPR) repeat protein
MGMPGALHEALHALTQVNAGLDVDIERLADMVPGSEVSTQALLHMALGAAYCASGRLQEAERDARSAVDYFATTDMITFHGNSAIVLGDVLRAAGREPEATDAFRQARDLYARKGSVVSVAVADGRLSSPTQ